jgi:hypothetical protein
MSADRFAQAAVDRLDQTAHAMERKWGVDRLSKLVDPTLAARFRAQAEKLNEALRSERSDAIATQAAAMERAWKALDAAATGAGIRPLAVTVWETVLPSTGEIIAIVQTKEEALAIAKDRGGAVWSLDEVAVAIDAFGEQVREVKATFPGAAVTAVRPASLPIGSPPAPRETKPSGSMPARARRRRSASAAGFHAPLDTSPSSAPPIDWERGDEIPF